METPPPLPASAKPGLGAGKVILIVFASLAAFVLLAFVGFGLLGLLAGGGGSATFTPADIEARCRQHRLDYHASGSDSRLLRRAGPGQEDRLEEMGVKVYRIKIRRGIDVVFGISVIESRSDFTPAQVQEVLAILAPATPVAAHGRFIYCNAFRSDPRSDRDDVIFMTPQELYDSL